LNPKAACLKRREEEKTEDLNTSTSMGLTPSLANNLTDQLNQMGNISSSTSSIDGKPYLPIFLRFSNQTHIPQFFDIGLAHLF